MTDGPDIHQDIGAFVLRYFYWAESRLSTYLTT